MKKIIFPLLLILACSNFVFAQENQTAEKTTAQYIEDLSSNDINIVKAATTKLIETKTAEAIQPLAELLKNSKNDQIRVEAAIAIGLFEQKIAIEGLDSLNNALLNDTNSDVRYAAILSISRIGSAKSLSYLKEAKEKETDPIIKDYIAKMEQKLTGK